MMIALGDVIREVQPVLEQLVGERDEAKEALLAAFEKFYDKADPAWNEFYEKYSHILWTRSPDA